MSTTIYNTSKGLLKKLFGKDQVHSLSLKEQGSSINMEKSGEIQLPFQSLKALKVNFYFEKTAPYRTLTLLDTSEKEYSLNVDPYSGEVEKALKHYAHYQLHGDIPDNIEDLNLTLQHGLNDSSIKLESGKLVLIQQSQRTEYPWNQLEYYKIDYPSNSINLKFESKKLYVTLNAIHVTNLWLFLRILEKFAKKA